MPETSQSNRVPAGVPTGGQFAASARGEADGVALSADEPQSEQATETVTLTVSNMRGEYERPFEVDPHDPISFSRANWLACDTKRPDIINRLAEQVLDLDVDPWGTHDAFGPHRETTYALIANPVMTDENRAALVRLHTEHTKSAGGSGMPSVLAESALAVRHDLGPETVDALSETTDRDIVRLLAERDDLTDTQIARLCDRPDAFYLREEVQREIARNDTGRNDPRVIAAMREAHPDAVRAAAWGASA